MSFITRFYESVSGQDQETEDQGAAWNYKAELPAWVYDKEVAQLAESKDGMVSMRHCAGPGIPLAWIAVAVLWSSLAVFTLVAYSVSTCTSEGKISALPSWVWVLWVPAFAFAFWVEWKCLRLTLIPYGQTVKKWHFLKQEVPFRCWLILLFCGSLSQRLDLATDGFFAASALADHDCEHQVYKIWRSVMEQSCFHQIGNMLGFKEEVLQFHRVVLASFVLLWVQLLYALLHSTNCFCERADYVIGTENEYGIEAQLEISSACGVTNFGDALHILGEPMGAFSLTAQKPKFPQKKADMLLKAKEVKDKDVETALSYVQAFLVHGSLVLGSVALLENSVQVNLQVSVLAMKAAVAKGKIWQDRQWIPAMVSICLSLALSLEKIKVGWDLIRSKNHTWKKILDAIAEKRLMQTEEYIGSLPAWRKIERHCYLLIAIEMCLILSLSYALAKLFMMFRCEDAVWNITGCADLSHVL
eukprot:TRINITY_DN33545_c0_g1_i1.p1 TRINITY_DN33545_c0_g1~~TRINITY_DN33545_c0_g1_i1.p1  ORF type:complete len:483 (+),score=68.59 TRINITY_DN33545_c0_g1_i1:36-1451(+)